MPLFRDLRRLKFTSRITFPVGENGSGKSILLEGLAVAANAVALAGCGKRQFHRCSNFS
jgi:predicted ATPase